MRPFILAALFLFSACRGITTPVQIEGAVPYANANLATTWTALEQCSGLSGPFAAVRFYTATSIAYGDGLARGLWEPDGNRIYILVTETANLTLWRHEMMHALLQGGEGHPPRYFNGVCGNLTAT